MRAGSGTVLSANIFVFSINDCVIWLRRELSHSRRTARSSVKAVVAITRNNPASSLKNTLLLTRYLETVSRPAHSSQVNRIFGIRFHLFPKTPYVHIHRPWSYE